MVGMVVANPWVSESVIQCAGFIINQKFPCLRMSLILQNVISVRLQKHL